MKQLIALVVLVSVLSGCATFTLYEEKKSNPAEGSKTELKVRGPKVVVENKF